MLTPKWDVPPGAIPSVPLRSITITQPPAQPRKNMTIEWWHWMVLGVGLVLLELAIPAFFVIWFGLGALIVGLTLVAAPAAPLPVQIVVWIAASLAFVFLWFKVFKVHVHRTRVGLSKGQFAGEVGLVTRAIKPFKKGQIRFQKPILGAEA